jgi:protoporphyrinogen oxidase
MARSNFDLPVVVLGAGPAGLTAGYELARRKIDVVVLEADEQVGGLARTEERDGYRFDLGGHRFFTKSQEVDDLWHEVMAEEFLLRPRMSRIYWNGRFMHYPLQAKDVVRKLGPVELARALASYAWAAATPRGREDSFEDWVCNRFGRRLFELFFKSYTEKVWGVSTHELRAEWAAQRIKDLSFFTAAKNALLGSNSDEVKSLITEFHYPRFGPGQMWEAMRDAIEASGGDVRVGTPARRLELEDGRVVAVHAGGQRIACSSVISSLPLRAVPAMTDPVAPEPVLAAARGLRYRDFLTVALVLDGEDLFPDNWIYIHEPSVRVGRIQNYRSWSPWMVPDETKACVGLEYFCFQGDDLWNAPDDELVELAISELDTLGLARRDALHRGYVTRVPLAYPMYDEHYAERVATIRGWLDGLANLQQVGRNGLHRYNNSDHSMLTAIRAVENLADGAHHDIWAVNAESVYHEEDEQPYRRAPVTRAMQEPLTASAEGVAARLTALPAALPPSVSFSVIVPATNRPDTITECVQAVEAALGAQDELLVIDDISHRSPAYIRNYGATRARGDVLVFVDADVLIHPDALERLRAAYAQDPELVAAFGSYDTDPPPGLVSSFRNLLHHFVHQEGGGRAETFWAGIGAIRRDVFLALGGFDAERFPRPMLEDVELGLRLTSAGRRIVLTPEVQGRHLKRWTLGTMLYSDFRDRGIPWTRLLIEQRKIPATLNLGWRHRFTAMTVAAAPAAAIATRRPVLLAVGAAAVGVLNRGFYTFLYRRGGLRLAAGGMALHVVHHATAMSAMPLGVVAHVRRGGATPLPLPLVPAEAEREAQPVPAGER